MGAATLPPPWLFANGHASLSSLFYHKSDLDLHQLKQIQAQLFRRSLHHDNILVTKLVSACSAAGATAYAARLFRSLPDPDLVLCNCMLKAYTLHSLHHQAISFYVRQVLLRGFAPDRFTFPYVLKACAGLRDVNLGKQVHASLTKSKETSKDVILLNSVVDMYFKCCQNECARKVFEAIQEPNSTSWNMMMSGLLNSGDLELGRTLFDEMPHRHVVSWNTLMSAYAKAGKMDIAQQLFDEMPQRDSVSWNVLIAGYSQIGQNSKALIVFLEMIGTGTKPDNATLLSVASACSRDCSVDKDAFDQIIKFLKSANSVSASTALLNLYAKVGRVEEARDVFDGILEKDLVAWNAMITAYSQNKRPTEAIELFRLMQKCNSELEVKPDKITLIGLIDACSQIGMLSLGEWLHAYIKKNRIKNDIMLTTALIDMYAKCGDLSQALRLFSDMPKKDLASWNAMIKGMAIHGLGREAVELFSSMERDGFIPNDVTFVGLLTACSHGELIEEGLEIFKLMQNKYSSLPCIQHYGCVVDLLGRAGRIAEAYKLVNDMSVEPDAVVWGALLAACRCHDEVEIAEEAARRLVELDPRNDAHYVLLSNEYASKGKWADVAKLRARMREYNIQKVPGCSLVELNGVVHEFRAGDMPSEIEGDLECLVGS